MPDIAAQVKTALLNYSGIAMYNAIVFYIQVFCCITSIASITVFMTVFYLL